MTLDVTISGIKLHSAVNRGGKFSIVGFGDVHVPDLALSLYGVALTYKPSAGYRAMPPRIEVQEPRPGRRRNAIEWAPTSPLAVAITQRLQQAFEAVGGQAPTYGPPTIEEPEADEPATIGLRRFVGDPAVAEAMTQAGL